MTGPGNETPSPFPSNATAIIHANVDEAEAELDADRKFFDRRPRRRYRVRHTFSAEARSFAALAPHYIPLPGHALFVAIFQIWPDCRLRFPFTAPVGIECDLSEHEAKEAFRRVTGKASGEDLLRAMQKSHTPARKTAG